MKEKVTNHTAVLVLGIISICICFAGLITGIIALVMAKKSIAEYNADPERYDEASFNLLKAGKTCAIIGVCLQGAIVAFYAIYFLIIAFILSSTVGAAAF